MAAAGAAPAKAEAKVAAPLMVTAPAKVGNTSASELAKTAAAQQSQQGRRQQNYSIRGINGDRGCRASKWQLQQTAALAKATPQA